MCFWSIRKNYKACFYCFDNVVLNKNDLIVLIRLRVKLIRGPDVKRPHTLKQLYNTRGRPEGETKEGAAAPRRDTAGC